MIKLKEKTRTMVKEDIGIYPGNVYGHLTVLADVSDVPFPNGEYHRQYLCECDCPNHTLINVMANRLKNGMINDCGCVREYAIAKIGDAKNRKYKHLSAPRSEAYRTTMINSCYNPQATYYFNAEGQNIEVCPQWMDPENGTKQFYDDMAPSYISDYEIDRIDYTKGFTPENTCWTPHDEYMIKVRGEKEKIYFDGHSLTLRQWINLIGVDAATIRNRYSMGWPMYEVLYGAFYKNPHAAVKNAIYFFDDDGNPIYDQTKVTKGDIYG